MGGMGGMPDMGGMGGMPNMGGMPGMGGHGMPSMGGMPDMGGMGGGMGGGYPGMFYFHLSQDRWPIVEWGFLLGDHRLALLRLHALV